VETFKIIRQTPRMSEKNQHAYLGEFKDFGNHTLIAFAVMGGVFSEGIDLVGESLSGVILVGVGLPKKTPERDIIMDYYSSILGNGYNFAYRYPGFNKILQAAGRVIRSETDRGFILLLDERYETPEYQVLFPEEWKPVLFKTPKQVRQTIADFLG
jgi:Rad3-related DNA helicase